MRRSPFPTRPRPNVRRFLRRPLPFRVAATGVAVVTGVIAAGIVERAGGAAGFGAPRTVVVVARAVAAGDTVDTADVIQRSLPSAAVPDGAVTSTPVGRRAVVPLFVGHVVVARQLAPAGASAVAAALPRGRRAVAVPTGGLAPPLRPGDVVDVLVTVDGADPPTFAVATAVPVVHVTDDVVTVAVAVGDVERVAFAATRGVVTLVVVPP